MAAEYHFVTNWSITGTARGRRGALRTTVRWHLDNPPAEQDVDFSADDKALASIQ